MCVITVIENGKDAVRDKNKLRRNALRKAFNKMQVKKKCIYLCKYKALGFQIINALIPFWK